MIMLNRDCHSQSNFMGTTISFNVYSLRFYAAKLSCIPHDPQCVTPICMFVFSVISYNYCLTP